VGFESGTLDVVETDRSKDDIGVEAGNDTDDADADVVVETVENYNVR